MKEKIKILMVDDDQFLLGMYAAKFEKNNFEVKTAASGQDAILIIKAGYIPDILILDLIMPSMDGFAIFEEIKKENLAPKAVTIMLTNQGQSAEVSRAKELGFKGFIVKAMTVPSDVVEQIAKIYQDSIK